MNFFSLHIQNRKGPHKISFSEPAAQLMKFPTRVKTNYMYLFQPNKCTACLTIQNSISSVENSEYPDQLHRVRTGSMSKIQGLFKDFLKPLQQFSRT